MNEFLQRTFQDVTHGMRVLSRSLGFSLLALTCVALGIGVTTTIFSAVNGILLRSLPYSNDGGLFVVHTHNRAQDTQASRVSWADYDSWRQGNRTFEQLGIWMPGFAQLTGPEGDAERVDSAAVSGNVFDILGIKPLMGRVFSEADEKSGQPVTVLSYGLWQRRFGSDPGIVGRRIEAITPVEVIGVLPRGVGFPEGPQLWTLNIVDPAKQKHGDRRYPGAIGRLRSGVTPAQAAADVMAISRRLQTEFPSENAGWDTELVSLRDDLVGSLRRPILIFLGAALLVLLIACANVANLMLARGAVRRREMAVRIAIGAGRAAIIRQVLVESLIIAFAGGAAGTLIAYYGIRLLSFGFPDGVPSYIHLTIDGTVLIFTAAVALATGIIFGIAPALGSTRMNVNAALHESARGSSGGVVGSRLRTALVVTEIALSLILMIGATLLIRSDMTLEKEIGFDPAGILSLRVPLPAPRYDDPRRRAFYLDLFQRIRAVPGVTLVGSAQGIPFGELGGSTARTPIAVEGRPQPRPGEEVTSIRSSVSTDYLAVMGMPVLHGRGFKPADHEDANRSGIVNEAFVRRLFPNEDPLGKRVRFSGPGDPPDWITVIGVVRNHRLDRPPLPIEPAIYLPYNSGSQTLVIKTTLADPLTIVPAVRGIIREMDPLLPTYLTQTVDRVVDRVFWQQRLQGRVLGIFGALALLLALFGIYAVVSYAVAQRTREFGVRMALGASRGQVVRLVLVEGGKIALVGVGVGVVVALALTRLIAGLLYGVRPADPLTFVGVSFLLGAVAVAAAVVPARRAAKVDPLLAMRAE